MSTTVRTHPELDRALNRWESITMVGMDLGYRQLEMPAAKAEDCFSKGPVTINAGYLELVGCQFRELITDAASLRIFDSQIDRISALNAERVIVSGAYVGTMEVSAKTEVVLMNAYVGRLSGGKITGTKRSYVEVDFEQGVELDLI